MQRTIRTYNLLLIVLFFVVLSFPMVYSVFVPEEENAISESENRILQAKPQLDITYLDNFPETYSTYFDDHFPFRNELLDFYANQVRFSLFSKSPIPDKVIIGRKGFLFQTENQLIYNGTEMFSEEELHAIARLLHDRAARLNERGILFYLVMAPMKCDLYPEYLPYSFRRDPRGTRTDHLITQLKKDTLIHLIDVKPQLLLAKDTGKIYHRTDHHWSPLGGYCAYRSIIQEMAKNFPVLIPLAPEDLLQFVDSNWRGGLANMSNLSDVMREQRVHYYVRNPRAITAEKHYTPPSYFPYADEYEIRTVIEDTSLPSVVVIRDSFFGVVQPFFQQNFRQSVLIFDSWQFSPNWDIIEAEKPDAVLLEMHEPFIDNLLRETAR